ncbi:hypothetical protein EJB05_40007, partial [Eragrostis curvula]
SVIDTRLCRAAATNASLEAKLFLSLQSGFGIYNLEPMVRVDPSLAINLEHHQQGGAHGFSSLDGKERLPAITTYK